MATGDVVFEVSSTYVSSDEAERVEFSSVQTTEFRGGTATTPSSGWSLQSCTIAGQKDAAGGPIGETLFDGAKRYKITVTEG